MTDMSKIKEHMEVIGADGVHVGTVDRVENNRIKLVKSDSGEAAGSDVVLIDPQYAPKVIAKHDEHDVDLMVALISTVSRDMHINLFQRFSLMRYWRLTKGLPFSAFLSKDELHMNDWSYDCIAKLLARAVAESATRMTIR